MRPRWTGLSFVSFVGSAIVRKANERWVEYRRVSPEKAGKVALQNLNNSVLFDDEDVTYGLESSYPDNLSTRKLFPSTGRYKRRRRSRSVCCGTNCASRWKAIGIVLGIVALWNLVKLTSWVISPTLTGIGNMPEYSTSLGCIDAPYQYMGSNTTFVVPIGDHRRLAFLILGTALGTLTLVEGTADSAEVVYDVSLRRSDTDSFDDISLVSDEQGQFTIKTPSVKTSGCMRYDIVAYLPRNLRSIDITSDSVMQLRFPEFGGHSLSSITRARLDSIAINLRSSADQLNMFLPTLALQATQTYIDIHRGWLIGDLSLGDHTELRTQRGDAVTALRVVPSPSPTPLLARIHDVSLVAVTGTGPMNITYAREAGAPHRRIDSTHVSERGGDLYLTYDDAKFSGVIDFFAKSYSTNGLQWTSRSEAESRLGELRWAGSKDGDDTLSVSSPGGWVGLYM